MARTSLVLGAGFGTLCGQQVGFRRWANPQDSPSWPIELEAPWRPA